MSNFWGHFFHAFGVNIFIFNFYETPIASAVKNCMIKFSKLKQIELSFYVFLGKKCFFLELQKILNQSVLQKGLLLQDWVFRLGKFLLDPKIHFLSLIYKLVFLKKCIWKYMKKRNCSTWIWTRAHQIGSHLPYQLGYWGLVIKSGIFC